MFFFAVLFIGATLNIESRLMQKENNHPQNGEVLVFVLVPFQARVLLSLKRFSELIILD